MADNSIWWEETRPELLLLIERLRPDDALAAIRAMVAEPDEAKAIAVAAGVVLGSVQRCDDETRRELVKRR